MVGFSDIAAEMLGQLADQSGCLEQGLAMVQWRMRADAQVARVCAQEPILAKTISETLFDRQ